MNIKQNIKTFIESNIDLIDAGRWEDFFYLAATSSNLSMIDASALAAIIYDIGMEQVNDVREKVLFRCMDEAVQNFSNIMSGVSQMPLKDFVDMFLNNCVGFWLPAVQRMLEKNEQRWKQYIEFDVDQGIEVIRRVQR